MNGANHDDPVVIAAAARTPIGGFQASLASLRAPDLGGAAIAAALERAGIRGDDVAEVLMGCVLTAGQGQAPARQAAFAAGLPEHVPCSTINKMCGSGMKTVMIACEALATRPNDIVVAGGMESMTNAPHLLPKMRAGLRLGHGTVSDHMFLDGLEDAYDHGRLMGTFAEDTAEAYQFTRAAQDGYAVTSLERARRAAEDGTFEAEIVPVEVNGADKPARSVDRDEHPQRARPERIAELKPAFRLDGTVTAANSSSISDGAAALVVMRQGEAERRGIAPMARVVATVSHARAPAAFTTAPIGAINMLLERAGWSRGEVGLFEINEAFAVVPMAAMRDLGIPHDVVNVHGGACALGHPIGASGARILVTLINAMKRRDVRRGVAAICIGGGEATAMALELAR
jgi:acetyl-CoA C-acetyltransferase